jgi:hypothetical protein
MLQNICEKKFSNNILALKFPKIKPTTPLENALGPKKTPDRQSCIKPRKNPAVAPFAFPNLTPIKVTRIKITSGLTPRTVQQCNRVV